MKKILSILLLSSCGLFAKTPTNLSPTYVASPGAAVVHHVEGTARIKFMLLNKLKQPLDLVFCNKNNALVMWDVVVKDANGVEVWNNHQQLTHDVDPHAFSLASNKILEKVVEIDMHHLAPGTYHVHATLLGNSKIHAWTTLSL